MLAMSASQKTVLREASMKMTPSGARSVPGVNTISGISDAFKALSAGLVGRDSGDRKLIMPCIRA